MERDLGEHSNRRLGVQCVVRGSPNWLSCFLGLFTGPGRPRFLSRNLQIQNLCERVVQIAATDVAVLVEGESGTGKELVARALHLYSARRRKPFVTVNGGAIHDPLVGSELFGHVAGAFSGALTSKRGLIEEADGGVFFIDEGSEMSPKVQMEILRWTQEGEYYRVGDSVPRWVDTRLVVASNKDLGKLAREGKFRLDLYYRFKVAIIRIPPLRERPEDIPLLTEIFLSEHAQKCGKPTLGVTSAALEILMSHPWPGNIRELKNCLQGLAVTNRTGRIEAGDVLSYLEISPQIVNASELSKIVSSCPGAGDAEGLSETSAEVPSAGIAPPVARRFHETERHRYTQAYFKYDGNRTAMARDLATSNTQVRRKIRQYKLE